MKKVMIGTAGAIVSIAVVVFLLLMNPQGTENSEAATLQYESSQPMNSEELMETYKEKFQLYEDQATAEIADIGVDFDSADQGKRYKLLWADMPETKDNDSKSRIEFYCQVSQSDDQWKIDKVLGMSFRNMDRDELYFGGTINVWVRGENQIEFVCNGDFYKSKQRQWRLQPLGIGKEESKGISISGRDLINSVHYCYVHYTITL